MLSGVLQELRRQSGLTLREVERRTGVSNPYLNQLERSHIGNPSPHVLHKLAACYGVPYVDLLRAAGYPLPENGAPAAPVFVGAERLTAEDREEIQAMITMKVRRRPEAAAPPAAGGQS